jgi:hypothetical protein
MDKAYLEKVFSKERMAKYFAWHPGDEAQAAKHYQANILVSEAFYPLLTIFEVALRNSLNREMAAFFGTDEWYKNVSSTPGLSDLNQPVTNAIKLIAKRGEAITAPKVTAELMLGFWVRLMNVEYEMILWKPLRRAFPFMLKAERQRHNVSAPLNRIRDFRNRIFHHEPVCWNLTKLESLHTEIYTVIGWINKDLPSFAQPMDRVLGVMEEVKKEL